MRILGLLSVLVTIAHAIEPPRPTTQPTGNGTKLLTFNTTVTSRPLQAQQRNFAWYKSPSDSDHVVLTSQGFGIQNAITGSTKILVPTAKLPANANEATLNADQTRILWSINATKQYRYSFFADYVVQDIRTGAVQPLTVDQRGDILYAEWSPSTTDSNTIAFVRGNNLHIWRDGNVTKITTDGGPDMFHGVPDWVYEEEVLSSRSALWFSPDGEQLAFMNFDESGVPTYQVPYYLMKDGGFASAYPRELKIRYPKVNVTNPRVSVSVLDLTKPLNAGITNVDLNMYSPKELVIGEVAWVTDAHARLLVRGYNRVQNQEKIAIYDLASATATVTRSRDGSDGWLDNNLAVKYVGRIEGSVMVEPSEEFYVDLSDVTGWQHIYLWPASGGNSIALTYGQWEVRSIISVDKVRSVVYYTSTERHPTDSHLFSIDLKTGKKTALTDVSKPGYFDASFSNDGFYYLLSYLGPNVPYQELYVVGSSTPMKTVTDNAALISALKEYKLPQIAYFDLRHPSGYNLSAMLRWPANFNASKNYPVLLTPYGGPGAQQVNKVMAGFGWSSYIASDPELEFATFTVDNRGTGARGRKFRNEVNRKLGVLEPLDQIWAASELVKAMDWVDADHVGIWGWSYGGYLSARTVEAASSVISYAMITAPIQDWRLYDSIYTERYMGLLPPASPNEYPFATAAAVANSSSTNNYYISSIHNATGFKNIAGKVLLQHGSGDDNVHFQSTEAIVDLMVRNGVPPEKFQVQFFTDSDHSIYFDGANPWLYRQLSSFLYDEKRRVPGPRPVHQWGRVVDGGFADAGDDGVLINSPVVGQKTMILLD